MSIQLPVTYHCLIQTVTWTWTSRLPKIIPTTMQLYRADMAVTNANVRFLS